MRIVAPTARRLLCAFSQCCSVRLQADRHLVRLKPDTTYQGIVKSAVIVAVMLAAVPTFIRAQAKTNPVLDKLAVEFAAAYNAHDAAKVAAFYADDAVLMVPNEPMVKGRKSIEMYYNEEFGRGAVHLRLTPLESVVSGNRAFEMGSATVTLGPFSDDGKYIVIYKRVGRDWKIAYDIFNSDQTEPSIRNPDRQAGGQGSGDIRPTTLVIEKHGLVG